MAQMRIPTEIRFIAKDRGKTKHIWSGDEFYMEATLCGVHIWPMLNKHRDDDLALFSLCKNCRRIVDGAFETVETLSERIKNGS